MSVMDSDANVCFSYEVEYSVIIFACTFIKKVKHAKKNIHGEFANVVGLLHHLVCRLNSGSGN